MTSYYDKWEENVTESNRKEQRWLGWKVTVGKYGGSYDKGCIFDLDGTLTNTLDSLEYSVNETMKEIGMPQITKEQCRQFVGDGARFCLNGH